MKEQGSKKVIKITPMLIVVVLFFYYTGHYRICRYYQ